MPILVQPLKGERVLPQLRRAVGREISLHLTENIKKAFQPVRPPTRSILGGVFLVYITFNCLVGRIIALKSTPVEAKTRINWFTDHQF